LLILMTTLPVFGFSFKISGQLLRRDTMVSVDNASVVLKRGTNLITYQMVEPDGSFSFEDMPLGLYDLEVKAPGFYNEKKRVSLFKKDQSLRIFLSPQALISLGEVEVVGEKNKGTSSKTVISQKIREKSQASVTGDPLSIIGSLPGVNLGSSFGIMVYDNKASVSVGGRSTPFAIRGGTGNENVAFLDDALIPYPYHQAFPDSIFIDSVVGDMTIYKGVLPANYGQVMSSLLDIKTIDSSQGIHGKFNLGLLNTYLTLNGKDDKNHLSWVAGFRRTHYDFLMWLVSSLIMPPEVKNNLDISFPYYLDTQGRVAWQSDADKVRFLWQGSLEPTEMKYAAASNNLHLKLDYQNATADLKWKHNFAPTLSLKNSVQWIGGKFYSALMSTNIYVRSNALDVPRTVTNKTLVYDENNSGTWRAETEFSWEFQPKLKLRGGAEVYYMPSIQYSNLVQTTLEITNTAQTNITNVYTFVGTNTITNVEGLTFSYEQTNQSTRVYKGDYLVASPFVLMDLEFLDGLLGIYPGLRGNYVDYLNKWNLDPRLSIQWSLNKNLKFSLASGIMSEFSVSARAFSDLSDFKDQLKVPRVFQNTLGVEWKFLDSYQLSTEVYYKDYDYLITYKTNAQGSWVYQSDGYDKRVGGLEVMLTKNPDLLPLYGWLSFGSYGVWAWRDTGVKPYEAVANIDRSPEREWFLQYVQKYRFNLNLIWEVNKHLNINASFNWQSGDRITPVTNIVAYTDPFTSNKVELKERGEYASVYLPDEHSLSLKLEYNMMSFGLPSGFYVQANNIYGLWFYHLETSSSNDNVLTTVTDFDARPIRSIRYFYDANQPNGVGQEYRHDFLGFFDFGNTFSDLATIRDVSLNDYPLAYGVGFRLFFNSPVFVPVRLELGWDKQGVMDGYLDMTVPF